MVHICMSPCGDTSVAKNMPRQQTCPQAMPAQWLQHVVSFITAQVPGVEVLPLLIVGVVSHNLRDPLTSVIYDDATTEQRCPMAHGGMSSSGMDHFIQKPQQ